jgi:hypothetical protein
MMPRLTDLIAGISRLDRIEFANCDPVDRCLVKTDQALTLAPADRTNPS